MFPSVSAHTGASESHTNACTHPNTNTQRRPPAVTSSRSTHARTQTTNTRHANARARTSSDHGRVSGSRLTNDKMFYVSNAIASAPPHRRSRVCVCVCSVITMCGAPARPVGQVNKYKSFVRIYVYANIRTQEPATQHTLAATTTQAVAFL